MENLDYEKIIDNIRKNVKPNYQTKMLNGQVAPTVANLGAKKGYIATVSTKDGEYNGLSIEFLEDIRPLLTSEYIIKIVKMLQKENYDAILKKLDLLSLDQIQYILHKWSCIALNLYNNDFKNIKKKKYPILKSRAITIRSDPIMGKFKISSIGFNKKNNNSIVPSDWLDRIFNNAIDAHNEMDKLESRRGKPPVTYAIIYTMTVKSNETIFNSSHFRDNHNNIIYINWNGDSFIKKITTKVKDNYQFVRYDNIIIGFILDECLEPKKNICTKSRQIGVLVSRLQKAIRRGRYGSKILVETINLLNDSPNYNLPEHNFLRVSSSKQLVWRLFITILEDCRPFINKDGINLLDLILLVLITQKLEEYKFNKNILNAIIKLAVIVQYNDHNYDIYNWKKLKISSNTPFILPKNNNLFEFHNAVSLALENIIMMQGDKIMLQKYYSLDHELIPLRIPSNIDQLKKKKYIYHDPSIDNEILLASYDIHSKPNIILFYQACIKISLTTKEISKCIWDRSSSYNVRSTKEKQKDEHILSIQEYYLSEKEKYKLKDPFNESNKIIERKINKRTKRISFLILFGITYNYKNKRVIIAGTNEEPIKIKRNNKWEYCYNKNILNAYPKRVVNLTSYDPPTGYKWKKKNVITEIIDSDPYIDGKKINFFDGSSVIVSIVPDIEKNIKEKYYKNLFILLCGDEIEFNTILFFRKNYNKYLVNWIPYKKDIKYFNMELIIATYVKIFNQYNNIINIGPVTRNGEKMQNSMNYMLEGKIWAIFNIFSFLYPNTIKINGNLKFSIDKRTCGFIHLIETLQYIIFSKNTIAMGKIPQIMTTLWDHQNDSVNKIMRGFNSGQCGFGDASDVGSGKTLISLKIACDLIKNNTTSFSGILVLLPGNKLIKTWTDEIQQHTKDFNVIIQNRKKQKPKIYNNTIVITTMSTNRDYPIIHSWLLVVIDECLTVQNSDALWTEAAWKQRMMSKYLIMMSATFFRAKFDKLYYMLKMLQTGIPETREYLDTILLESIVSQIPNSKRKWKSNVNYFKLDSDTRKAYEKINQTDMSITVKYGKLHAFMISNKYIKKKIVSELDKIIICKESIKKRCLIYANSKEEAEYWSDNLDIPIYPKLGTHCIVTVHDGTYGLNDLIIYNVIIMRPPQPDLLPQIKGRLDRPGNKHNNLFIEYFVFENTIDIGLLIRMNIASQFVHNYIMPLARFYDISVNN